MKIYTKTGDMGLTSLLSGERTPKYDIRIKAYGSVDELNAFIGFLIQHDINDSYKNFLLKTQNLLYIAGALLAVRGNTPFNLNQIETKDIESIEKEIDSLNDRLPVLKDFILPGGTKEAALCHICRTVCRRAERDLVELLDKENVNINILILLNRLSDYFFVLSRSILLDQNVKEINAKC
jgi:cob(I)alamin adenosyltransferase